MNYVANYNMPGFLPDTDGNIYDNFDAAKRDIIHTMHIFADEEGENENLASEYINGAEEVNLQSSQFSGIFGNYCFFVAETNEPVDED